MSYWIAGVFVVVATVAIVLSPGWNRDEAYFASLEWKLIKLDRAYRKMIREFGERLRPALQETVNAMKRLVDAFKEAV